VGGRDPYSELTVLYMMLTDSQLKPAACSSVVHSTGGGNSTERSPLKVKTGLPKLLIPLSVEVPVCNPERGSQETVLRLAIALGSTQKSSCLELQRCISNTSN